MAGIIVVFDTNVLIPLMLPASRSSRLFFRLIDNGHRVVISPAIFAEVKEKMLNKQALRKWLDASDERIDRFFDDLARACDVVETPPDVPRYVAADPDDDPIVAAAVQCGAGYIVSEDRHLLTMGGFQGIRVVTRDDFACELDRLGVP